MVRFNILKENIGEIWKRYRLALTMSLMGGVVNGYLQKIPTSFTDTPLPNVLGKLLQVNATSFFYSDISLATALLIFFPFFLIDYISYQKNKKGISPNNIIKIIVFSGILMIIFITGYLLNIDPKNGFSCLILNKKLLIISFIAISLQLVFLIFFKRYIKYVFKVLINVFILSTLIYLGFFLYMPWINISDYNDGSRLDKPSIILIVEDSLKTRYLSPFFSECGITPNIEKLAMESTVFKNCISQSPWTLPSIASIWTGLPPTANAVDRDNPCLVVESLPKILSKNGYKTYAIVCTPLMSRSFRYSEGFDNYYLIDEERLIDYGLDMPMGKRTQWEKFINKFARLISRIFHNRLRQIQWNLAMKAVEKLPKKDAFLYIHLMDTHLPYNPPSKFRERGYDYSGRFRESIEVSDLSKYRDGMINIISEEEREYIKMLYRGEVRCADYILGRFVEILNDRDIFDDIIFIYTADHGEEHWEHNGFEHGHSVHREVVWVPLIIHIAESNCGIIVNSQARLMDIFPTILNLAGIDYKSETLAQNLLLFLSENQLKDREGISEKLLYGEEEVSFRDGIYTYIINMKNGSEFLYEDKFEVVALNNIMLKERLSSLLKEYISKELEIRKDRIRTAIGEIDETGKEYIRESLRSLGYVH
ncbi:MAG: sulfatase [bacterium]